GAWRVDELPVPVAELTAAVERALTRAGVGCAPAARDTGEAERPAPGPAGSALRVHAPLGRFTAGQRRQPTRGAPSFPPGGQRLTPCRGVVAPPPGADPGRAASVLARLAAAGLVTDAGSPWPRVGPCTGRPGCATSRAD